MVQDLVFLLPLMLCVPFQISHFNSCIPQVIGMGNSLLKI